MDPLRYNSPINIENQNDSHTHLINFIPENSCVLDVGCNCGNIGNYLFHQKHCQMFGIEYDDLAIEIARKTGCYKHIEQLDLNKLEKLPPALNNKFDAIILGDILEHLIEPSHLLQILKENLSERGSFAISLPNISHGGIVAQLINNRFEYTDVGILDRTHLRFFTYRSIAQMLANLNLEITECKKTYIGLKDIYSTHTHTHTHTCK